MRACLRDLMSPVAATVQPGETLRTAAKRLLDSGESEVYVVDEQQRLLGLVSDYEILKAQLAGVPADALVAGFISRPLEAFAPDFSVERLAGILRDGRHTHVPVVDHGCLVGRVNRREVLRSMVEQERDEPFDSDRGAPLRKPSTPQPAFPEPSVPRPRYLSAGILQRKPE